MYIASNFIFPDVLPDTLRFWFSDNYDFLIYWEVLLSNIHKTDLQVFSEKLLYVLFMKTILRNGWFWTH